MAQPSPVPTEFVGVSGAGDGTSPAAGLSVGASAADVASPLAPAPLEAGDLVDDAVLAAAQKTEAYGYHHGPIPHANGPVWVPPRQAAAKAAGKRVPDVGVEDNASPPNPMARLSSANTLIYEIVVDAQTQTMCGRLFSDSKKLHRHTRTSHAGAILNPDERHRSAPRADELRAGHDAIKAHVLRGGWRVASFQSEPRQEELRKHGSLVIRFADQFEEFARRHPGFAQIYGKDFHRAPPPPSHPQKRAAADGQLPETETELPRRSAAAAALARLEDLRGSEEENSDSDYDLQADFKRDLKRANALDKRRGIRKRGPDDDEKEEGYASEEHWYEEEVPVPAKDESEEEEEEEEASSVMPPAAKKARRF